MTDTPIAEASGLMSPSFAAAPGAVFWLSPHGFLHAYVPLRANEAADADAGETLANVEARQACIWNKSVTSSTLEALDLWRPHALQHLYAIP